MSDNFKQFNDDLTNEFFKNYRGRYSSFWIERFGLIPELPTSFDNANSIYELLAWLQRAFKQLLDDFVNLENEFEDFKNAMIELLEYLIPELIRRFAKSEEFRTLMKNLIKDLLDTDLRDWFKEYLKKMLQDPDFKEYFKEYLKELMKDPAMKEYFKDYIRDLITDPKFLQDLKDKLGIKQLEDTLQKIIDNLKQSGAWQQDGNNPLEGHFNSGRNIATGNINVFGGSTDGNSFIRTNNGQTENDLAGGV